MSNSFQYDISTFEQLIVVAQQLATEIKPSTVLALQGELGAGKTTFTQQLLKALGVQDSITSPTFSLINQYSTQQDQLIYHLDLYRLKNKNELKQLGLEELLTPSHVVIIEWPELASSLLPATTWWLQFQVDDQEKRTVFIKKGE